MNHRMRRIVETLACERRYGIADAKGAEYSQAGATYKETGADTLANFKNVGKRRGVSPETALMVYLDKHMDSISTAVKEANVLYMKARVAEGGTYDEDYNPRHVYAAGEGIVSRLDDARNYLDLLECVLIDTSSIAEPDIDREGDTAFVTPMAADPEAKTIYESIKFAQIATPQQDAESDRLLKAAGLVEGLDGVWRGKTVIDESVKNPGEKQTPICYGETGELDG